VVVVGSAAEAAEVAGAEAADGADKPVFNLNLNL
jgi:hypothetical protein